MPQLFVANFGGPTDYKSIFQPLVGPAINYREIPSFQALIDYGRSQPRIREHYSVQDEEGPLSDLFDSHVTLIAIRLVDRYLHIYGDAPFEKALLLPLYLPIERFLLRDPLYVNIVVPILFLNFDFDIKALNEQAFVARIPEPMQLSRALEWGYESGAHTSVMSAATHAFILPNWQIQNRTFWEVHRIFSDPFVYPLDHIDAFFAALRIVTGLQTGCAQLLFQPRDWAAEYTAHLPPLQGTHLRQYPAWFEKARYRYEVPTVSEEVTTNEIAKAFTRLLTNKENRIRVASQRLNRVFLRENEEDSILDATIALEALLGEGNQEMTYKLAVRLAALLQQSPGNTSSPTIIFERVKHIYDYRSKVAHGSSKAHKKREIRLDSETAIPTVDVAVEYLRMALGVLLERPEYLDPLKVDTELVLKASPEQSN